VKAIWPFRHFGLKVLSFALALVLWMMVSGEETIDRGLRVPLEMRQFPGGLQVRGEPPSTVDVRLRGASGLLSRLGPGDVVAVLDVGEAREGRQQFQLTPERVRAPFGVEVKQVMPETVTIVFEQVSAK
jgi:YbbR domain-containing protein